MTELVFILDRSGSMSGLESDTIGGFNSMIKKQLKEDGEAVVSTVLFDTERVVIHDREAVFYPWLYCAAGCSWRCNSPYWQHPQVRTQGRCT